MPNLQGKNILVTGGTGFIGRALCQALLAHQAKVFVLTRGSGVTRDQITFINNLDQLGNTPIHTIINLAGEPIAQRWTGAAKQRMRDSRLGTTAAVVDYMRTAPSKPSVLISGSAIGYYGTDATATFNETTPPCDTAPFARQLCADWEAAALQAEALGVRTVLLRIGAVLEKDGGMLAKLLPPFRLGMGGPIGDGRQWLSWIDREDIILLMLHIIATPSLRGPVNATAPEPVVNTHFAQALAGVLHRPCLLPAPAFLLRAAFGEMPDEIMLAGQKVLPQKALDSGFVFRYPTLQASLQKILG